MKREASSPHEIAILLRRVPVFEFVENSVLAARSAEAELRSYESGDVILREGDPAHGLYAMLRGVVRVYYESAEGVQSAAKIFGAPTVFGEMEALLGSMQLENADVLKRAELVHIPPPAFLAAVAASPALSYALLVDVSARLCIAAENERSLAFGSVEQRLAAILSSYVRLFGVPVSGGTQIVYELSQQDLADHLGTARKSVQRALDMWRADNLVVRSGKFLLITDLTRLVELAGERPARLDYRLKSTAR